MRKALLVCFLFSICLSKGQNYYDDAQLRQHINIEKRFGDAFSDYDNSQLKRYFVYGIGYSLVID